MWEAQSAGIGIKKNRKGAVMMKNKKMIALLGALTLAVTPATVVALMKNIKPDLTGMDESITDGGNKEAKLMEYFSWGDIGASSESGARIFRKHLAKAIRLYPSTKPAKERSYEKAPHSDIWWTDDVLGNRTRRESCQRRAALGIEWLAAPPNRDWSDKAALLAHEACGSRYHVWPDNSPKRYLDKRLFGSAQRSPAAFAWRLAVLEDMGVPIPGFEEFLNSYENCLEDGFSVDTCNGRFADDPWYQMFNVTRN